MKGAVLTVITDTDSTESENQKATSEKQTKILLQILEEELTDLQRETFWAYHFQRKTIPQIAAERAAHKSTVSRTLKRAEQKVMRFMKYCRG